MEVPEEEEAVEVTRCPAVTTSMKKLHLSSTTTCPSLRLQDAGAWAVEEAAEVVMKRNHNRIITSSQMIISKLSLLFKNNLSLITICQSLRLQGEVAWAVEEADVEVTRCLAVTTSMKKPHLSSSTTTCPSSNSQDAVEWAVEEVAEVVIPITSRVTTSKNLNSLNSMTICQSLRLNVVVAEVLAVAEWTCQCQGTTIKKRSLNSMMARKSLQPQDVGAEVAAVEVMRCL